MSVCAVTSVFEITDFMPENLTFPFFFIVELQNFLNAPRKSMSVCAVTSVFEITDFMPENLAF